MNSSFSVSIRSPSATRIFPNSLDSSTSILWISLCALNSCFSIRIDSFTLSVCSSENHISMFSSPLVNSPYGCFAFPQRRSFHQDIEALNLLILGSCHRTAFFLGIQNIFYDFFGDPLPRSQDRNPWRVAHDELPADSSLCLRKLQALRFRIKGILRCHHHIR